MDMDDIQKYSLHPHTYIKYPHKTDGTPSYMSTHTKHIIRETLEEIANLVSTTYGPNGNTVIITDIEGNPYSTKDGVSVMSSIWFDNTYKDYINKIIKQVADKTVEEAGDGTTTSIVLAAAFIIKGVGLLHNPNVSYKDIKAALEELEDNVLKELIKSSRELKTAQELYNVALIASNNDEEIATTVSKAFKDSKMVKVEKGDSFEDVIKEIKGMQLRTTYLSSAFVNNLSKKAIEYGDSNVIIVDGKLQSIKHISAILPRDKPCIIIAEDFNEDAMLLLKQNHNKGIIKIAPIKSPGMGQHRKDLLSDIADYTGATVLEGGKSYSHSSYLGEVTGFEVGKENCILFNKSNKVVEEKLKVLAEYRNNSKGYDKELVEQRIEGLEGNTSIIEVGGNSPFEMQERYDRIDDAVRAVGCAIEEGIIEGGGVSLAKQYYYQNATKTPYLELSQAMLVPYQLLGSEEVDPVSLDMFKLNIIDPLKVTRCAFQNAISVAKTLLGTSAIIMDKREWKN